MKHITINSEPTTEVALSHAEQLVELHSRFSQGQVDQGSYNHQMQAGLLTMLELARDIDSHYGPEAEELELLDDKKS